VSPFSRALMILIRKSLDNGAGTYITASAPV
jgi:hypothetical protein